MALLDGNDISFVHAPGLNPAAHLVGGFPAAPPSLATVHWVSDPALGLPLRPHEVSILRQDLPVDPFGHTIEEIHLDQGNGFRAGFRGLVAPEEGAICITAITEAVDGKTELFATGALGDEVPGTRQSAMALGGAAFLGPHVFGLQATGEARLWDVTIFSIPNYFDGEFEPVAHVAPTFASVATYQDQSYLGTPLDALGALDQRLWADAIARQNTAAPAAQVLVDRIHRRDPHRFAQALMASDIHALTQANHGAIMVDPGFEIPYTLPDSTQEVMLRPASLWQYLACAGSVEAATLGQAVTLPLRATAPMPLSGADLYRRVLANPRLPFPLIRVASRFGSAAAVPYARSYARLALPLTGTTVRLAATVARRPVQLDGPATADLELRLSASRAHAGHFIARGTPAGPVYEIEPGQDDPPPRLFFFSGEAGDQSQGGAPTVWLGPVDLPLTGPAEAKVFDQPRDVFGRWPEEIATTCPLEPWPVSPPSLLSVRIDYRGDGIAELGLTLCWDWTLRRPSEIRVGLRIGGAGSDVLPEDGLQLPEGTAAPLLIRFDATGQPALAPGSAPGFSVRAIAPPDLDPETDPATPPPATNDLRSYLLAGPLGRFESLFYKSDTTRLVIAADALEAVSGQTEDRRSRPVRRGETLSDPRPPMLIEDSWRLIWTARPNGAGRAFARISRPQIAASGGRAEGFNLWRAGETAVLDLAIAACFADAAQGEALMAAIRAERNKPLRLQMIHGLVGNLLLDPAFRRDFVNLFASADARTHAEDVELDLPGTLDGFEFAMYSVLSTTGMASDKTEMGHLVAIAVPQPRPPARPDLRLITDDPGGLLALGGHWLALVGSDAGVCPGDIRIFWDDSPLVAEPDDLLHPLTGITALSAAEAARYLPGVEAVAKRLGRDAVHYLLLAPPQGWLRLAIAAEIVADPSGVPEERAVSQRSALVTGYLPPVIGPRLVLRLGQPGGTLRVVGQSGLFVGPVPGFAECEIYFEIATHTPGRPLHIGPAPMVGYAVATGVPVGNGMTARYDTAEEVFHLTYSGAGPAPAVTMICTDPAGRAARITV